MIFNYLASTELLPRNVCALKWMCSMAQPPCHQLFKRDGAADHWIQQGRKKGWMEERSVDSIEGTSGRFNHLMGIDQEWTPGMEGGRRR